MHGGAFIRRIVRAQGERKQQQSRDVGQGGDGREPDRRGVLAQERRSHVAAAEAMQHRPADSHIRPGQHEPARGERRELTRRRHRSYTQQPRPHDEPGGDGGVLLAEQPGRQRGRAQEHALPLEGRVQGEQREHRGHQFVPAHDIRHRLDMDRVDGEHDPRHEPRRLAGPTAAQYGDEHTRRHVPRQVHHMKPDRRAREPVQRVGRHDEGAVDRRIEVGREV